MYLFFDRARAHKKHLINYVRVCVKTNKHETDSDLCMAALSSALRIAAEIESEAVYPKIVCHGCYLTLRQIQTARSSTGWYRTRTDMASPCLVCNDATAIPHVRPRNIKANGRPRDDDVRRKSSSPRNLYTQNFSNYALTKGLLFDLTPSLTLLLCPTSL